VVFGLVVLASVLLASCGDDGDDADTSNDPGGSSTSGTVAGAASASDLEGRTFTSVDVEGHELVDGSTITLQFVDGRVAIDAGCNSMNGPVTLTDGHLEVGDIMSTMMGCEEALMAQDQWISELLTAGPTASIEGATLTLVSDGVTLVLAEEAPTPTATLVGPTWTAESIVDADAISSVAGEPPTFTFHDDDSVDVFDGCSTTTATVAIVGDALVFAAGELGPPCPPDAPTEWANAVTPLLSGGPVTYTIEGDLLSLRSADGSGLDLRADG
jgi:heat shock protein HslJ